MLLLDTNVAIHVRDADAATLDRLEAIEGPIGLSIITLVELEGGVNRDPASAGQRREALERIVDAYPVLPFEAANVLAYRSIVESLGFSRPKLLDRMIAAQAIAASATLATLNPRDFRDIPGLRIDDWSLPAS